MSVEWDSTVLEKNLYRKSRARERMYYYPSRESATSTIIFICRLQSNDTAVKFKPIRWYIENAAREDIFPVSS